MRLNETENPEKHEFLLWARSNSTAVPGDVSESAVSRHRHLLRSAHIEVSYFAAGIIAHIVTGEGSTWDVSSVSRRDMLDELVSSLQTTSCAILLIKCPLWSSEQFSFDLQRFG